MKPCVICDRVTAQGMRHAKHPCCFKCIDMLVADAVDKKTKGGKLNIERPWWVE
jgi:hypothetical protein